MLEIQQYQIAKKILGEAKIAEQILGTLDDLGRILDSLETGSQAPGTHADTIHGHLNFLSGIGASKLAAHISGIETNIREALPVASDEIDTARRLMISTQAAANLPARALQ